MERKRIARDLPPLPLDSLAYSVAALRTNMLKSVREIRQGALFCYGMSCRLGTAVWFAHVDEQDYDIAATYKHDGEQHFVPIQLKELVPDDMPVNYSPSSIQEEIAKLGKYVDSPEVVVVFHINRRMSLTVDKLLLPTGKFAQRWFLGGADAVQSRWFLIGDLLKEGTARTEFHYPSADLKSFSPYTTQRRP